MANKAVTYVPRPMPTLDKGSEQYLQLELASISQSIKTIIAEIAKVEALLAAHGIS
ncbi:hypothetical protein [Tardiphaga sp. 367_B4_N1_1]|uniref:hypothetical protein n=1 Tax=Tardiphaga sp. 367_B4_N1_1 TaxID=3240777 RepID=UPI003F1F7E23